MAPRAAGGPARRVVIVSGPGIRVQGGPATPIVLLSGPGVQVSADPPLICVQMPAGTRTTGQAAMPVVQVAAGGRAEGDTAALPVVLQS